MSYRVHKKMMAIETLNCDPTVWSDQESFFASNHQNRPQTLSQNALSPKLTNAFGEEWNTQLMKDFWDSFEGDLHNDPEFGLEVMPNCKDSYQTVITKNESQMDSLYMNASTFLSPLSMEPSSPAQHSIIDDNLDQQLVLNSPVESDEDLPEDLENTSAMDFLNNILAANSANNSIDDEFNKAIDYFSSNSNDSNEDELLRKSDQLINELLGTEMIPITVSQMPQKRKSQDSIDSNQSNESNTKQKSNKRTKRQITSPEIKKERKKNQNKSAANRYRIKQRATQEIIEKAEMEESKVNEDLKQRLEKLQMEFKVVFPLAKAAFASDPNRSLMLQMLQTRVLKQNLLDSI